jgi:DNA replication factor GINS
VNLDELQSVQSRERQTDSLQQLRESFYRDAGEYVQGLRAERERAAERADDPWNDPDISRLSDDIETAEGTVQAIYERRVGKIVKMASLAAADVPTEDDGLTDEERQLFGSLVSEIERSRDRVEAILDGQPSPPTGADDDRAAADRRSTPGAGERSTTGDADEQPPVDSPPGDVDAASLMGETGENNSSASPPGREPPPERAPGTDSDPDSNADPGLDPDPDEARTREGHGGAGGGQGTTPGGDQKPPEPEAEDPPITDGTGGGRAAADGAATGRERTGGDRPADGTDPTSDDPIHGTDATRDSGYGTDPDADADTDVDRVTVRITDDVGEIYGIDRRSYDLSASDVVTLPETNADPLVESGAAERLE